MTLETSSLKKNFSISFWITSLLEVEAIFTGLLRLIPIHFLNDVFIFLGREDEDCKFNFFFFLLRGDLLFHMKEEQDKSESSNPSEGLSTAAGFLINYGSFKRSNLRFCLLKAFFLLTVRASM